MRSGKRAGVEPDGLDRSSNLPLYAQIVALLRGEIRERGLAAGTALPSEAALCKRFGVARSVVRQALSVLVTEGVIRREPGRAPTVAARTEHRRMVQRSTGLFDQFADMGTPLRSRVLRLEIARPPQEVAAFFASSDTWLLERLRRIDDTPLAYVRTWLPRGRVPELEPDELTDASLHQVLATRYGLRPGRGRHRIRAVAADSALAVKLEVAPGSPLLMLEGQGLDADGRPMEWFTTWHRAEQLVFDVEVDPAGEQVQPALSQQGAVPGPAALSAHDPGLPENAVPGVRESSDTPYLTDASGSDPLSEVEQRLVGALQQLRALRRSR